MGLHRRDRRIRLGAKIGCISELSKESSSLGRTNMAESASTLSSDCQSGSSSLVARGIYLEVQRISSPWSPLNRSET